jgi:hypothetical protein
MIFRCSICAKIVKGKQALAQHCAAKHGGAKAELVENAYVHCGVCYRRARLVGGEVIYPHRPDLFHKRFWLCDHPSHPLAYVGCHPGTENALGSPADTETRKARSAAHAAFDPLWKGKAMGRWEAYKWLAATLGIHPDACHIGMMSADMARRVVEAVRAR